MGRQSRETTELQWRFPLFFCWQWLPRLPPRQTPRLRLTPTFCTEDTTAMASATVMDTDTPMEDTTTERGVLMLSPRLMLTLTSCTVDTTAMVLAMDTDMDTPTATDTTATTAKGRLRLTLRSLLEPTPTLPTPMLPLPLSPPPSPSPTRPSPPPLRPTLLPPMPLSPLPLEATRPLPVTTVS